LIDESLKRVFCLYHHGQVTSSFSPTRNKLGFRVSEFRFRFRRVESPSGDRSGVFEVDVVVVVVVDFVDQVNGILDEKKKKLRRIWQNIYR
jgi:hypothetical protein